MQKELTTAEKAQRRRKAVALLSLILVLILCLGLTWVLYRKLKAVGGTPEDFEDVLTYGKDGAGEIDGWQIHLLLIPRYEKAETDAEDTEDAAAGTQWLHLFYENAAA